MSLKVTWCLWKKCMCITLTLDSFFQFHPSQDSSHFYINAKSGRVSLFNPVCVTLTVIHIDFQWFYEEIFILVCSCYYSDPNYLHFGLSVNLKFSVYCDVIVKIDWNIWAQFLNRRFIEKTTTFKLRSIYVQNTFKRHDTWTNGKWKAFLHNSNE